MSLFKDFKYNLRINYLRKLRFFFKKNFPKINRIVKIIKNKEKFQFEGWDMYLKLYSPWDKSNQNPTFDTFEKTNNKLYELVENNKFILSQFPKSHDIIDVLDSLRWRHYLVTYTAYLAITRTKSKNFVECGVCDGLTAFYAFNASKKFNCFYYLYDSWDAMREQDLVGKEIGHAGRYYYLNIDNTKKNLESLGDQAIFNKGYIPEVFKNVKNPEALSWLHIDTNSSNTTLDCLNFFYEKLENNGVILFDDYAHINYEDTRKVIDSFLNNKKGNFLHFPTGQAFFIKTN